MKPLVLVAFVLRPPLGLDLYMPVPESNPLTPAKVALGRRLFFDKRLSRDGTLACASCHDPKLAFSDGRMLARGIGGAEPTRNAPAIINRGYGRAFFWDGRAKSLEQQVLESCWRSLRGILTQRPIWILPDARTLSGVTRRSLASSGVGCWPPGHFG